MYILYQTICNKHVKMKVIAFFFGKYSRNFPLTKKLDNYNL